MDDSFKRPNKLTGKPFEAGFEDEDGRVFFKYLWSIDLKCLKKKFYSTQYWSPIS